MGREGMGGDKGHLLRFNLSAAEFSSVVIAETSLATLAKCSFNLDVFI